MERTLTTLLVFSFAFGLLAADKKKPAPEAAWKNTRNYKILTPKNYDPKKKYAFILSLHGFSSSGAGQAAFFPLADLAEKHGFIYCFPSGLQRSWNASNACCDWANKNDDSAYLRGLILHAQEKFSVDKKRVYVTGLSNGGFMSYRMAYDHADLVTAIVPFAGVGFKRWPGKPKNPVSVLHVHGTKDNVIKWKGGSIIGRPYPSAQENFKNWRLFNQCDQEVDASKIKIDLARTVRGAETTVTRFKNKTDTVTSELWQVNNGGHVTPPSKAARERIIKWMLAQSK
jgi:polyhydroxybutyrate depolymerase